jgi:hypothetical protein
MKELSEQLGIDISFSDEEVLQYAIVLSALLYAANSGPSGSGKAQAQISDTESTAKSKVGEYTALFIMIPLMITFYINEARKVTTPLTLLKNKIQYILDIIIKLRLYILSLYLNFEEGCDDLLNSGGTGPVPPEPPDPQPTALDLYIELLNQQYEDVYNQLYASGNTLGIKRIFALKENLEEDYNIGFKTVNIVDPNNPTLQSPRTGGSNTT